MSVMESALQSGSASATMLELHEIQATVLWQRPAPYFGSHAAVRIDESSGPKRRREPWLRKQQHRPRQNGV